MTQNEEFFRSILDVVRTGVWVTDKNDKIFYANEGMEKIAGIARKNVVNSYVLQDFPEETLKFFRSKYNRAKDTLKPVRYDEVPVVTPASRNSYQSGWLIPRVVDGMYEGMICTVEDVTGNKRAEEEIENVENFSKTVLNSVRDAISVIDVKDYSIVGANKMFRDMYGTIDSGEDVIGRTCYKVTHNRNEPCNSQMCMCPIPEICKTGVHSVEEHTHYDADGNKKFVEVSSLPIKRANGKVVRVVHVQRDVTARKMLETKLLKASEEWRVTFDSIGEMISSHDKDHNIVRANKAFVEMLGLEYGEVVGRKCYELLHGAKEPLEECPHKSCLRTGEASHSEIFESYLGKSFKMSISPIFNKDDEVEGTVHIMEDITKSKRMEEEKEQLHIKLLQAQKLESIGTMANGIAHSFNNILGAVRGYADMALKQVPSDSPAFSDLKNIIENTEDAKELAAKMLAFSRESKVELKKIQLHSVIEKSLRLCVASMKIPVEVSKNISPDCGFVMADAKQIQQVVMNLCTNSYHAILESGGILEVSFESIEVGEALTLIHSNLHVGPYVRISVADTAHGMDSETVKRVFEPFFTTKDVGKGTGLGLSMVHGIVMAHKGEVTVHSELGKGTTVNVYLPVVGRG